MTERDERALRDALQELGSDEPVDLGLVRRRAAERRRNARTMAGLAVVLVLVAGVVGVPRLLGPGAEQPTSMAGGSQADSDAQPEADARDAGQPRAATPGRQVAPTNESAPDGWRTEYYRDITFRVPTSWGYARSPVPSWCSSNPDGQPRPEQLSPYVWLGPPTDDRLERCAEPLPAALFTEHVSVVPPEVPYQDIPPAPGWHVVTKIIGQERLVALSRDRDLAERIVDSGRVDRRAANCDLPTETNAMGARPDPTGDLTALRHVDEIRLCQYPSPGYSGNELTNLRAVRVLTGAAADQLLTTLQSAPVDARAACDPMPYGGYPEIFVLVRMVSAGTVHDLYVSAVGCPGSPRGMAGGIDDGTTVRLLTRAACQQILVPPLALFDASGAVAENCLG